MNHRRKERLTKILIFIILVLIGMITCIHPLYPNEQYLQHLGTIILLALIVKDLKQNKLTLFAFSFFSAYLLIHIIGARYIYSYVPYKIWINSILNLAGIEPLNIGNERNGYDRFVHFASGIFLFPIIFEHLNWKKINNEFMRIAFTWTLIQTISMTYELFEWGITFVLSPEAADDYNGQQGDMWDAQKDMFLAMVGSAIMVIYYLLRKNKQE